MRKIFVYIVLVVLFSRCGEKVETNTISKEDKVKEEALFTILNPSDTKLNFINVINESPSINGVLYEYLYNGGGVAVGDFNNDNLPDIYFTSNLYSNKLFINKGNLVFEETTLVSKVKGKDGFPTGVALVDINSDGLLDIYVCKSGDYADLNYRRNELYVNKGNNKNGIPVFEEEASLYGLDLPDYSTQAAFFDYDKDGDLDMFLINHGIEPADVEPNIEKLLNKKSEYSSDKLFRNDKGKYTDVSAQSGILNNSIGFGLGIAIGDLNNDQWPDILVGQDYSEKDHLYINQKDGTYKEVIRVATNHISNFSMGNDIGDINNDGWLDFISLDMVSNNNYDLKTSMSGMNPKRFYDLVGKGLHHQYMFNALQVNNGDILEEGIPAFSDVAKLAGISNTNWSWAPLLFDMDNDGWQDFFVSNGVLRSFRNNDFVIYKRKRVAQLYEDLEKYSNKDSLIKKYYEDILAVMPEKKEVNLLYLNNKDFSFSEKNADWKLTEASCTNGAVYADLDNDGDLDIIGNNINSAAYIYKNNTRELGLSSNYLKVKLEGSPMNKDGIGARVILESKGIKQTRELYLSRGFQSSVDRILHFGISDATSVDNMTILWPDGKTQSLSNIASNQQITVSHSDASNVVAKSIETKKIFNDVTPELGQGFVHKENEFNDFERESLLPHKMSQNGPALSIGDVNNDGLDDFYIGGAKGQSGELFIQQKNGKFYSELKSLWLKDKRHEDVASVFFDADGDGDVDLYVVSGGYEEKEGSDYYQDRLYENMGDGTFSKASDALPDNRISGSCVRSADYDNDGDLDLFVGGKLIPGKYPLSPGSYLLKNESQGGIVKFTDATNDLAPFMSEFGMVSNAEWVDLDNDEKMDLVVVGEWTAIKIIKNLGDKFADVTIESGLENQTGWWYSIASADFDNDGDQDFIVGNLGTNYKYQATTDEPFEVYANDFDKSGSLDIVLGYHENGKVYPLRGRECSSNQMPFIKKKFPSYNDYGLADISTVYGEEDLKKSLHYAATTFATSYVENLGNFKFKVTKLDGITQFSSVNSILIDDFNNDGNLDALLSGNLYQAEVETPRNDAGYGVLLEGNGKGEFTSKFPYESGLFVKGDVKNAGILKTPSESGKKIVFAKNDDKLQVVGY
ncbi:VCBS repeat-containing protein [Reichenbachiella sp. MALMAid0571]|uniref:VCBS repeat-containing protein n=1 Tax=Reichenbachiella sp. MALMAid0571 TaxID=3143939 RepID=UPI0032DFB91C